ncbi:unnamed protein product [Prorocentrum cordatum]|uniref:Uncharacterized protein n=1 Tax=Prorocentrum cordatum TaxID=2364126 RepID=A0ABN9PMX7_9DINO|nr:unnamed protein product [Polarella glacialis]
MSTETAQQLVQEMLIAMRSHDEKPDDHQEGDDSADRKDSHRVWQRGDRRWWTGWSEGPADGTPSAAGATSSAIGTQTHQGSGTEAGSGDRWWETGAEWDPKGSDDRRGFDKWSRQGADPWSRAGADWSSDRWDEMVEMSGDGSPDGTMGDCADPEKWESWANYRLWRRKIQRWRRATDIARWKQGDRLFKSLDADLQR